MMILLIFAMSSSLPLVNGLYVQTLPSNVIYADDFENYTANQLLGANGGFAGGTNGWSYVDNAAGGTSNITTSNSFSCCKSLITGSPTAAGAVFDVDRRIALPSNTTRLIQVSIWFAYTLSYINENLNDHHISIETWDAGNRYEAPVFFYSRTTGNGICPVVAGLGQAGMEIDFIGAPTNAFVGTDHVVAGYCLSPYDNANAARGEWHHYRAVFNIITKQWVSAEVDGIDFTSTVAGLFFSNHAGGGDNEFSHYNPKPVRFEIGAVNAGTHTVPADTWAVWQDNLVISDVTPGGPPVIQFGISLLSGWFGVLIASIAMLYSVSGIGLIRRVWFNHPQGILSSYRTIVVTGIIATIGFIVLLVVGTLLTQQVCSSLPQGTATCSY